jgi:hypothetical protein
MRYRLTLLLFTAVCLLGATPAPKPTSKPTSKPATKQATKPVAPDSITHSNALFLRTLSDDGKQIVHFRAAAIDKHFFLEEPAGVTVYEFDGAGYKKVALLRGATLAKAMKKYAP